MCLLLGASSFCRQLIYNYPEQLFSDAGVMAIEHADFEGIERLALVLGKFTTLYFVPSQVAHTSANITMLRAHQCTYHIARGTHQCTYRIARGIHQCTYHIAKRRLSSMTCM